MFTRKILGTLTAAAIAAGSLGLSAGSASATYGGGFYFGGDSYGIHFKYVPQYHKVCKVFIKKVKVGWDYYGHPIFKKKKIRKCWLEPIYYW